MDWLANGTTRTVEVLRPSAPFDPATTTGTWEERVVTNGVDTLTKEFFKTGGAEDSLRITSPEGRRVTVILDAGGRPEAVRVPNLDALEVTYDEHGRPTVSQQGERIWRFGYDGKGRLDFVRDTLHRMTQFEYSNADRMTSQTLPGVREVGFDYDRVGNLRSLTTPLAAQHQFAYTKTGLNQRYTPPGVAGVDSVASVYEFNADRQLTEIARPGGSAVALGYDGAGRLNSVTLARGSSALYYSASTGQLDSLTSPDTITVDYRYLGPLPTIERWSGHLPGGDTISVARVPDRFFRDSVETVSGTDPVTYAYDRDGLLTGAGPLSIHHRADNGALDSTHVAEGGGEIASSADYERGHPI